MNMMKKYWFIMFLPLMMMTAFYFANKNIGSLDVKPCQTESDRPNCYIFYGIAQNDVTDGKLKINYLIEGFPKAEHDVFVEMLDDNELDFLYSEKHTSAHKAHYAKDGGQRSYKATYRIPKKLKPGIYKLRVTFRFYLPLGSKNLISNDIIFKVI